MEKAKKTIQKNNITIDDLAVMVAKGFGHVEKRFEKMDKRFDAMDERFDVMDERFTKIDQTLYEMQSDILTIKERLNKIEQVLGPLLIMVDSLKIIQREFDHRLTRLEKKVGINK